MSLIRWRFSCFLFLFIFIMSSAPLTHCRRKVFLYLDIINTDQTISALHSLRCGGINDAFKVMENTQPCV